jgi:hypothetical protein
MAATDVAAGRHALSWSMAITAVIGVVDPDVTVARQHEVRVALEDRSDELPNDVRLTAECSPRTRNRSSRATTIR